MRKPKNSFWEPPRPMRKVPRLVRLPIWQPLGWPLRLFVNTQILLISKRSRRDGQSHTERLFPSSFRTEDTGFSFRYGPETVGLDLLFWRIGSTAFLTPSRNSICSNVSAIKWPPLF